MHTVCQHPVSIRAAHRCDHPLVLTAELTCRKFELIKECKKRKVNEKGTLEELQKKLLDFGEPQLRTLWVTSHVS